MKHYLWNILVFCDEGINVLLMRGNAHETVSQRAAWSAQAGKKWGCVLCKFLDWVQPNHCENSVKGLVREGSIQG